MKGNPFKALIDLLYPRLCQVCGNNLMTGEKHICSYCLYDFPLSGNNDFRETGLFASLSRPPEMLYSLFYYNKHSRYRNLIYAIKYKSGRKLGTYLGTVLGEKIGKEEEIGGILPVPLHPSRRKRRGFNQTEEIALGIDRVLNAGIIKGALVRVRNNPSQTGMEHGERMKNVDGIFAIADEKILENKHILLVDDVITTGATLGSCLKTLEPIKGLRVSVACLARTLN